MLSTTIVHVCARCGSARIRKNGHATHGAQRAKRLDCARTFILEPAGPRYDPDFKEQVLAAYQDRLSLRGLQRTFGVCYETVMRWLGKKAEALPAFADTLLPSARGDVLELDELWSLVGGKAQTLWLWAALCRRTRQIVAWSLGDRREQGAADLRAALPKDYRRCRHPQRSLASLPSRLPREDASLLRQARGRNLPRRTLVLHSAPAREPPGTQSLVLLQMRRKPPRRHSPLHHHLQPRHPTASNKGLNTAENLNKGFVTSEYTTTVRCRRANASKLSLR